MGACNLVQNNQHNQLIFHQQSNQVYHKVSSTMKTNSNYYLFSLSQQININSQICQQNLNRKEIVEKVSKKNANSSSFLQKKPDIQQNNTESNNYYRESSYLPFTQKQNIFDKKKLNKKQNRTSSISVTGDFLKIKQKQAISEYKVLSKISNKQTGQLYKVLDKTTNQVRSLQIIKQKQATKLTLHEINLLKRLDHQNIFHLYDVFLKKGFYYIVGQYIQGNNIYCLIKENQIISEKKLSKIIREVFQALNYLHYRGIMHRNVKPQTIVFQQKIQKDKLEFPAIKLINFKKATQIQLIKQQFGATYYTAPQIFLGGHNQKCDIWSVGIILYMLVMGQVPFKGDSKQQIRQNIIGKQISFSGKNWQNKSDSLRILLKNILQKNPSRRYTAKQALDSSWFKQASQKNKLLLSKSTMKNLLNTGSQSKFKTIIKTYLVKMTTSVQQRQEMAKKFQSIDKDKSGFIQKQQIISAYREIHGIEITKQIDIDDIINKIDINNSGLIDFSEFMAAIGNVQNLFAKQRLQKAFQFIDVDGTGQISVQELIGLLNKQIEENQETKEEDQQIAEIMKQLDEDGNKTISKSEFIQFFLKLKDLNKLKSSSRFKLENYDN